MKKQKMYKRAIVGSGGGMTCIYSAGCISALVDKYQIINPDIVIGSSGSAGTLAYYVSKQYNSIRNIWLNLLSTRKFINHYRIWKIINIDYLIDEVFKKQDPLDINQIYNSPINFLIPLTNAKTGKLEHFSNKDCEDIFEILRATKAMPLVYGKEVKIGNSYYCDTYLSSNIKVNIEKAKKLGAGKIIVLDSSYINPLAVNGLGLWVNTRSELFKKNYYTELKRAKNVNFGDEVFFLKPKSKLNTSILCNNRESLAETFNRGYQDTSKSRELKFFLSK
jgi:predicted patatin/cPLA2 family phospholipase